MKTKLLLIIAMLMFVGCTENHTVNVPQPAPAPQGPVGPQGPAGPQGPTVAPQVQPGLNCKVYTILASDQSAPWPQMFADASLQFGAVFAQLNVPNTNIQTTGIFPGFNAAQQALLGETNFAMDCSGYINIPESNNYTFTLTSDDGSELAINNSVLINMDRTQSVASATSSATYLYKGLNSIDVLYYEGPLTNVALILQWNGPASAGLSGAAQVVPATVLFEEIP